MSRHANVITRANLRSPVMPDFVPGLDLARSYYEEVIAVLIGDVPHAAGRLGWGSDVLGYDTERSTDHGWGPHLHVFVDAADIERVRAAVDAGLPETFLGWPTHYGWDDVSPRHWVETSTLGDWLTLQLGRDVRPRPTTIDWLLLPQQLILGVVGGTVFHDDLGELTALRAELEWYPDDLWLWLIACQWQRISQEEAFVGRTAQVSDELGSEIIAARLARDLMRLCFLFERRYAPYGKWFGTAFSRLDSGSGARAPPRTQGARPRVRGGRAAPQRPRHDRSRRPDGAAVLRPPVERHLRRALRHGMSRARVRSLAPISPAHRIRRSVGRLDRRPPASGGSAMPRRRLPGQPRSRTVIDLMRRSR